MVGTIRIPRIEPTHTGAVQLREAGDETCSGLSWAGKDNRHQEAEASWGPGEMWVQLGGRKRKLLGGWGRGWRDTAVAEDLESLYKSLPS